MRVVAASSLASPQMFFSLPQLEWIEGRLADVFTFRNGKVIQMRTFAEGQQALEWTGVKDSKT